MKQTGLLMVLLAVLLSFGGCASKEKDWYTQADEALDNILEYFETNEKNISPSDQEKQPERIDIIIEALETKDTALLKSVFSQQALTLADDMDEGAAYMLNLYEGEYEKTVYHNYSSTKSYGNGNTTRIDAIYVIKTTETCYRISYTAWTVQERNPDAVGIYSLRFNECEETQRGAGSGPDLAGISYPARQAAESAINSIVGGGLIWQRPEDIREKLSDRLLAKDGTEESIERLMNDYGHFIASSIGEGWVRVGGDKTHAYLIVNLKPAICVAITMDPEQPDKAGSLKLTRLEEDKTFADYTLETDEIEMIVPMKQ